MAPIEGDHFRLLGPVEMVVGGAAVVFGRRQHRDLLVLLLLHANRLLTVDRVVEDMWGGAPPATAKAQVSNIVSAVRRVLSVGGREVAALTHRGDGYRLDIDAELVDLGRFDALTARARVVVAADERAPLLRAAVGLWRGRALTGVHAPYATAARATLEERRIAAVEDLCQAELDLGQHASLVAQLTEQVAAHPFRERLLQQLMIALSRCGRHADALAAYRQARRVLADEHGLEPSAALQDLERRILRADPALAPEAHVGRQARTVHLRRRGHVPTRHRRLLRRRPGGHLLVRDHIQRLGLDPAERRELHDPPVRHRPLTTSSALSSPCRRRG
jgi:DNA-binding SARP family transcriptional activator